MWQPQASFKGLHWLPLCRCWPILPIGTKLWGAVFLTEGTCITGVGLVIIAGVTFCIADSGFVSAFADEVAGVIVLSGFNVKAGAGMAGAKPLLTGFVGCTDMVGVGGTTAFGAIMTEPDAGLDMDGAVNTGLAACTG